MWVYLYNIHIGLCTHWQELFQQVDFKQANLANPSSCERVFTDEQGAFDFVFHLAGETKYGQTDEVSISALWNIYV